ncbi:DUF6712 family protein [Prevotella sp.]|uniref:DUF6712 family protein n=1 Tax=Prevotella sp. TaxID=59823 RepID=UPI003AF77571
MILFTNQELRLHLPSNAVDDVANLQGMLDNSEKDFLKPRLGASLYDRLSKQYASIEPSVFCDAVGDGTYVNDPWNELLLYAQRMIVNDAMAQNIEKQALSVNGSGINVASSNDYAVATDKQIAQGKESYRQSAMTSLNNLLSLLEGWAKEVNTPMPIDTAVDGAEGSTPSDGSNQGSSSEGTDEGTDSGKDDAAETEKKQHEAIEEIVTLWQESKYYYYHRDLLFPTCESLQPYLDIYGNRDKFVRLIPDMLFIQSEYLEEAFGEDFIPRLLQADENDKMLKKARQLVAAYLKERTSVINFDKLTRSTAHNDAITVRESIHRLLKKEEAEKQAKLDAAKAESAAEGSSSSSTSNASSASSSDNKGDSEGYDNNQEGSRIFVTPILC